MWYGAHGVLQVQLEEGMVNAPVIVIRLYNASSLNY
jgi:hypothetical protein